MADKRIIDLTEEQDSATGDYLAVDNATDGTKKITPENLLKGTLPFSPPATLNECTWAQISILLALGVLSNYYNEGDTKTITLSTGEELTMQLASINDGTGDAGAYYPKNTADFVSVEVMQNSHRMNATATNVGGWNDSELRAYLNDSVYPTLPSDLKNFIAIKTHMRTEGNESTTLISADDKLWLPTLFECYGEYSGAAESANYNKQYSIFDTRIKRIKTKRGESTACWWWTSSPRVHSTASFCLIDSDGGQRGTSANDTDKNFAIGFRIGDSIDLSDYQTKSLNTSSDTDFALIGTSEGSALAHTIYGMSVQDGTPTPSVPVEIKSAKANFKCKGKNLINATLTSRTVNGLTVTKNQDGTYMISGTATDNVHLFLENIKSVAESGLTNGSDYRLCGCPGGGSINTYFIVLYSYDENNNVISAYSDIGSGTTKTLANSAVTIRPAISVKTGTTLNNALFKPMLTLDLNATYNDYEPYKETAVTTDLTLRALEVPQNSGYNLVKDGKYYIADTVDWSEDNGYVITRRVGHQTGGVVSWYQSRNESKQINISLVSPAFSVDMITSKMNRCVIDTTQSKSAGTFWLSSQRTAVVMFLPTSVDITSIQTAQTWIDNNPTEIVYRLATPTTEPITPEQAQALLSLKTYDEATSISATGEIEPSLDLEYSKDRSTALALTAHNKSFINDLRIKELENV